jgi:hypothetical protein
VGAAVAGNVQSEVRPFTMERELSQVQGMLKGLPAAGRYVAGGALVAAAAGLGYTAGGKLGTAGKVLGTMTVGAGAAYGVVAAEKERKGGAPVELNNALLGREPCSLQPEEVTHTPTPNEFSGWRIAVDVSPADAISRQCPRMRRWLRSTRSGAWRCHESTPVISRRCTTTT